MKRWVRIVLIVVLAAGLVVGLFGMLRRQTEDRKGAESYAEAPSHLPWEGRLWTRAPQGFPYEGKLAAERSGAD